MNRYAANSGFPNRGTYRDYIGGFVPFIEGAGAKLLWRFPVLGQAVGDQKIAIQRPGWKKISPQERLR
jgi:hypothetical protein